MNQKIVVIAIAVFAAIGCGEKEQEFTTKTQKEIVLSGSNTEKTEEINDSIGHFGSHHSFYHAFAICGVCGGVFWRA